MIKGDATLTVTHATLVAALQEYFQRHFAVGSCPTIYGINLLTQGNAGTRTFTVTLGDQPSLPEVEPAIGPIVRAGRRLDMEA